jgi:hypothetical protein
LKSFFAEPLNGGKPKPVSRHSALLIRHVLPSKRNVLPNNDLPNNDR